MQSAREFGRYRLLEPLGTGGMGVVHRAVVDGPEGFQRAVVIKRILPELSNDESFRRMLAREARLCAMLHHPGIVQVQDFGDVDGEYFLALEYVEGYDLGRVLAYCSKRGRLLPIGVVLYIIGELAAALAYAHDACDDEGRALEIVHRDVTPANVMLTTTGAVKLLDFGVARAAEHVRDERTRSGTLKGKVSYFSPEQAEAQPVDRRSDIFSLGIVMHEALTGRRLFRGANDIESLRMVRAGEIVAPSQRRPDVTAAIDAVVLRMLARDPAERYASCHEVVSALAPLTHELHGDASALRRCLDELGPIPAPPLRPLTAVTQDLGGELSVAPKSGWRRRRVALVAAALVGLGVAAGFAARALRTPKPTAPTVAGPAATPAPAPPVVTPTPSTVPPVVAPSPSSAPPVVAPTAPPAADSHRRPTPSRSRGPHRAPSKSSAGKSPPRDRGTESDREVPELKDPYSR